jgi:hypothetical protein
VEGAARLVVGAHRGGVDAVLVQEPAAAAHDLRVG